jgi:UDP-N-acetylglucosamine 2-epimerase (non-hydrolysing)
MKRQTRIAIAFGTRPEVIKLAPVVRELRRHGWCNVLLIPSGQHRELLAQSMAECGFMSDALPAPPMSATNLAEMSSKLTSRLTFEFSRSRPDLVLVHGDTMTALAGARAASRLGLSLGQVEAGLRTFNLKHPFPEEVIRQAITPLAQLHFAPTPTAVANLLQAGVAPRSIFLTGNTIVDHLKHTLNGEPAGVVPTPFILVTLHRRELAPHIDRVVSGLLAALEANAALRATVVLHPNPLISTPLRERLRRRPNIELISPLPHRQFLEVVRATSAVVTDSGGVQEEAAILGKPLVVVRKVTERPEIMLGNRAVIAGFDPIAIKEAIDWAISLQAVHSLQRWFGDGYAAERIVDAAGQFLSARQSKKDEGWRSPQERLCTFQFHCTKRDQQSQPSC